MLIALAIAASILATPARPSTPAGTAEATNIVLFPALVVTNLSGRPVPLSSAESYKAEFRSLRKKFRETDLSGPPVLTDGWTHNIAEAEWPLMGFCYLGYACANLARADDMKVEALEEMRWLISALQTPRMSGFVAPHFGPPFGVEKISISVFVHGHFLNLCMRYREVSGDRRYDTLIHRVAKALNQAFASSPTGVLKSYRDMWWISDNLPALSALARYDHDFKRDSSPARDRFLRAVKEHYLDAQTGLMATYVDADANRILQGPRGISTMYGLHFLRDVAPEFATDQYARARFHLMRSALGFVAVREFPEGAEARADIDSGPLVFGLGPSASGFAIGAAAVMGDQETARNLLKGLALVGQPVFNADGLRYAAMPPVGQAVILFGKTELLKLQRESATPP